MNNPPKLSAPFKPRAEAGLLSQLVQNAWTAKNASLRAACSAASVTDHMAALFARLYPAADMAVLAKYGQTRTLTSVTVRIHNPATKRWDHTASIDLPTPIVVPAGFHELYACGPRFSEEPDHGIKPEYRATLSPEEWQKIVDDHDHRDSRRLPKETEAFFTDLVIAQNAYKAEYREAVHWPQERKTATGEWPTWEAIATQFPVLGDHIRNLIAAQNR